MSARPMTADYGDREPDREPTRQELVQDLNHLVSAANINSQIEQAKEY